MLLFPIDAQLKLFASWYGSFSTTQKTRSFRREASTLDLDHTRLLHLERYYEVTTVLQEPQDANATPLES